MSMAAFHICGPIGIFLRDLGLDPNLLSIGDVGEVTRLCVIAGQDPVPVLRNTVTQNSRRSWRLGKEALTDCLCPQQELRFCPACLAEDDAMADSQDIAIHRRERLIWRLKSSSSCPKHRLPLIRRERSDSAVGKGVFAESVPETATKLFNIADHAEPCRGSPLQTYIADRLAGRPGPAWPDSLPLEPVIRITAQLGAALEGGPYVVCDDLPNTEQDVASVRGWSYIAKGEAGIRHALQVLQAGFETNDRPALSNIGGLSCHWRMCSGMPLYADRSVESSMSILPAFLETDPQRRPGFGLPFHHPSVC